MKVYLVTDGDYSDYHNERQSMRGDFFDEAMQYRDIDIAAQKAAKAADDHAFREELYTMDQVYQFTTPICPGCGKTALCEPATAIYGKRGETWGFVWLCPDYPMCDHYVGCHKGTTVPLGTMAGPELRARRKKLHAFIDKAWKKKKKKRRMKRGDVYLAIHQLTGIPQEKCHIGMMDMQQCELVEERFRIYLNQYQRRCS